LEKEKAKKLVSHITKRIVPIPEKKGENFKETENVLLNSDDLYLRRRIYLNKRIKPS